MVEYTMGKNRGSSGHSRLPMQYEWSVANTWVSTWDRMPFLWLANPFERETGEGLVLHWLMCVCAGGCVFQESCSITEPSPPGTLWTLRRQSRHVSRTVLSSLPLNSCRLPMTMGLINVMPAGWLIRLSGNQLKEGKEGGQEGRKEGYPGSKGLEMGYRAFHI